MVDIIIKGILTVVLFICAVQDVRKKKIFLWLILLGAMLVSICLPFSTAFSFFNRLGGVAIGVGVIIISLATVGKIGMGDALLLCITGLGLGFWGNLELFAIALLMASIISIGLLVFRMADRKKSIPFVPFLLVSFIFLLFAER